MILTVTFNAALDRLIFIDELRPGRRMVASHFLDSVGGKGFDASVVLALLGVKTLALGFVAGTVGQQLVNLLDGYGVAHDLIWLEGETRIAHVIAESKTDRHSHLIAGSLSIPPHAFSDFLTCYRRHAANALWIVAAGSVAPGLPQECYQTIVEIAHEVGIPILVDCTGPAARAAAAARPTILKLNETEFCETFAVEAPSLDALQRQAQLVWAREKLATLVVTCGKEGLFAVTDEGTYWAVAPQQQALNAAGAGDAASATLAWRRMIGDDWATTLQQTAAVSAAAVLTAATAEVRPADVAPLLAATQVQRIDP